MHPLSVFPQILFLSFASSMLLRLAAGFFFIYLAKNRYQKIYKWSAVVYALSGTLLVLGLYTQPAAIVAILILIFDFYVEGKDLVVIFSKERQILYVIIGIILLSLLFTGPGIWAFDLPL